MKHGKEGGTGTTTKRSIRSARSCANGAACPTPNEQLQNALRYHQADAVVQALQAGADPNMVVVDHEGLPIPPVIHATGWDTTGKVIAALLDAGADVQQATSTDNDVVWVLLVKDDFRKHTPAVLEPLLQANAPLNRCDTKGRTVLHHLCRKLDGAQALCEGEREAVVATIVRLLSMGASAKASDNRGNTALFNIAQPSNRNDVQELVQAWVKAGGDPHHVNDHGETLLQKAAGWLDMTLIDALISVGVDVNQRMEKLNGCTVRWPTTTKHWSNVCCRSGPTPMRRTIKEKHHCTWL